MKDEHELLWRFYQENSVSARHHEQQRTSVTSFFTALAAATLAVIGADKCIGTNDLPLIGLLIVSGVLAAVLSAKQYERFNLHLARARQYRNALARALPEAQLIELKRQGDDEGRKAFPRLFRLRLGAIWVSMHLLLAALGAVLAIGVLAGSFKCSAS